MQENSKLVREFVKTRMLSVTMQSVRLVKITTHTFSTNAIYPLLDCFNFTALALRGLSRITAGFNKPITTTFSLILLVILFKIWNQV